MRRFVLIVVLAAAALVLPSPPRASACSCATFDVREALPNVDGAFVGALVAREAPEPVNGMYSSATMVRYRFQVERVVRGDVPPDTVDVWSSADGASCGLESAPGQRTGLLLRRDGDRWTSSLCSQVDPDVLIRAAQPLPPPPGKAPPAVLVGTTHGPGRIVSLDGLGRVIAYGGGDGMVTDIAFCSGGDRLAEAYSPAHGPSAAGPGVALRTADGLEVVWERLISADGGPGDTSVADVACLEGDGGTVLALAVRHIYSETPARHRALILAFAGPGEPDLVWQGEATTGTFTADGRAVYLNGGADGRDLQVVDLANPSGPATRTLGRLPEGTGTLTISPDGRHLAGVTTHENWSGSGSPPPPKAVVIDASTSPAGVVEADLGTSYSRYSSALWSGPDRIVFAPRWAGGEPVRLFDRSLHELARWAGWGASHAAVVGDTLVGLDGPKVVTAPVTRGPAADWADLESGLPGAVAPVPGGAEIGSAPPASTTTSTLAPTKPAKTAGPSSTTTAASAPASEAGPGNASTTTTTAPSATEPAPGDEIVALPGNSDARTGGRPLLAGGAGAALLAAGLAGFLRRRAANLP